MKRISLLPNLLTLANYFCGLLAISKGIDALTLSEADPLVFYRKLETAAQLIFLAMVFDALDGKVARMTRNTSEFGAQLDSLADALTFGVAPALVAKVLLEHESLAFSNSAHPRLHFTAAGIFSVMAVLRLARFNLETDQTDQEAKQSGEFRGLPSPAAAGAVASLMLFYMILREPRIEMAEGVPTPVGDVVSQLPDLAQGPLLPGVLALLAVMLPVLGFLMVSRVPYPHVVSVLSQNHTRFLTLVAVVLVAFALGLAPVPALLVSFNGYVFFGLSRHLVRSIFARRRARAEEASLS